VSQRADALTSSFSDCFTGIDALFKARLLQPCLVLLYSTIDAAASLERATPDSDVTKSDFLNWVERYILGLTNRPDLPGSSGRANGVGRKAGAP
jgi:hypothetical protein